MYNSLVLGNKSFASGLTDAYNVTMELKKIMTEIRVTDVLLVFIYGFGDFVLKDAPSNSMAHLVDPLCMLLFICLFFLKGFRKQKQSALNP